jgi:putative IMPACT (imprinted ancient) family translation regulator
MLSGAYHWISVLDRLLPPYEAQVDERIFDADVTWRISVPEERCDALVQALTELSRGGIRVTSMS